jgi:hypothetical protein
MLETDTFKRPDINYILNKPFLLKYIKLNLIRQISHSDSAKFFNKNFYNGDNSDIANKEIKTRSNSSDSSSKLNLKFNSIPNSYTSDSQKNSSDVKDLNSITINEEISVYKIESDSSKNSTNRLNTTKQVPMTNQDFNDKKQDRNSVFTKIEKLKKFLENFLGLETFLDLYFQINEYYLNGKSNLTIDFSKYKINDKKTQNDIIKLIKSLIRLENELFN